MFFKFNFCLELNRQGKYSGSVFRQPLFDLLLVTPHFKGPEVPGAITSSGLCCLSDLEFSVLFGPTWQICPPEGKLPHMCYPLHHRCVWVQPWTGDGQGVAVLLGWGCRQHFDPGTVVLIRRSIMSLTVQSGKKERQTVGLRVCSSPCIGTFLHNNARCLEF